MSHWYQQCFCPFDKIKQNVKHTLEQVTIEMLYINIPKITEFLQSCALTQAMKSLWLQYDCVNFQ